MNAMECYQHKLALMISRPKGMENMIPVITTGKLDCEILEYYIAWPLVIKYIIPFALIIRPLVTHSIVNIWKIL